MRNQITIILLFIFLALIIFASVHGIEIGGFKVLSVQQLLQKNEDLNGKIATASTLTTIDYEQSKATLEETYEKQQIEKQKYEELMGLTDSKSKQVFETKQYDVGYLWKVIGKNATKRNLKIGMNVQKTTGQNLYDLNFSVSGQYPNTIQFITDIENNSDLNFRIYNFKMTGSGDAVSSTFSVKGINIDPDTTIGGATASTNNMNQAEDIDNGME